MKPQFQQAFDKAFAWLDSQKDQFALSAHPVTDASRLTFYKPLGELLMVLLVLRRAGLRTKWVNDTAAWAWAELSGGADLVELVTLRQDLPALVVLYTWFRELGFESAKLERAVRYLIGTDLFKNQAMVHYRRLEIDLATQYLTGRDVTQKIWDGAQTAGLPEPWAISEDVAYTMTHEVFYVTDFGHRRDSMRSDIAAYLGLWLPVWFDIFKGSNWDVYGELLTVAKIIGRNEMFLRFAPAFIESQLPTGAFKGPAPDRPPLGSEKEWNRAYFLDNYHTTFVALMAFAIDSGG